jgi:hypothetical protein
VYINAIKVWLYRVVWHGCYCVKIHLFCYNDIA